MTDEAPMWIRLIRDFDHRVANQTTAFKAGMRTAIIRTGGDLAVSLGHAVEIPAPNRPTADALKANPWAKDVTEPGPVVATRPAPPAPAQQPPGATQPLP